MKRYEASVEIRASEDRECRVDSSNAVTAINSIHKMIQLGWGIPPQDYRIKNMVLVYNEDSTGRQKGELIRSGFDVPGGPNPNLSKEEDSRSKEYPIDEFEIIRGLDQGKLAD